MRGRVKVLLAVALALGAGLAVGRSCSPRPPARIEWRDRVVWKNLEQKVERASRTEAPTRIVTRWRVPPASTCPARPTATPPLPPPDAPPGSTISFPDDREGLLVERIEERGEVREERRAETARAATGEALSVGTIVLAPRASWAVYGGLQLAPERAPVLGLGRRLFGPVWIEGQITPRLALEPPAAAVLVRVEW